MNRPHNGRNAHEGALFRASLLLFAVALAMVFGGCTTPLPGTELVVEPVQESSVPEVDEAAVSAIRQWIFEPARAGGDIFPWLTGLARNEIRRVLSRERSAAGLEGFWKKMDEQLLSLYAMLESEPFGEDLLVRRETQEMVNATMAQLPPHYGTALEAKYIAGKSVREIAASLGTSLKAAESLLTRARNAFRVTFLTLAKNLPAEPTH